MASIDDHKRRAGIKDSVQHLKSLVLLECCQVVFRVSETGGGYLQGGHEPDLGRQDVAAADGF